MTHILRKPIQLVTQSQKFRFVSRKCIIDDVFSDNVFLKWELGRAKPKYLFPDGRITEKDAYQKILKAFPKLQIAKHMQDWHRKENRIQEITVTHLIPFEETRRIGGRNSKTVFTYYAIDGGPKRWPDRFYHHIRLSYSEDDITKKLIRQHGFCDFPFDDALEECRTHPEDDPYLEIYTGKKGIPAINEQHLFRKVTRLTEIIRQYRDAKTITSRNENFLREEVRNNVVDITVENESFATLEIVDFDFEPETCQDKNIDFITERGPSKKGVRVFGHFALSCLELLHDIEQRNPMRYCKNPSCQEFIPAGFKLGTGSRLGCSLPVFLSYIDHPIPDFRKVTTS